MVRDGVRRRVVMVAGLPKSSKKMSGRESETSIPDISPNLAVQLIISNATRATQPGRPYARIRVRTSTEMTHVIGFSDFRTSRSSWEKDTPGRETASYHL